MSTSKPDHSHRPFVAILLAVFALGFGALFLEHSRNRDKVLLDYARLSIERERMEREFDLQEARYWDSKEQRVEARELQRFNSDQYRRTRERAEVERWQNQVEAQVRSAERENRASEARVIYASRHDDLLERQQAQRDRQVAQQEVDRQNRWVRQREYEEERARHDRYYRNQAEETQRRWERSRDEFLRQRAHGL